jgi:uncharacterized protein
MKNPHYEPSSAAISVAGAEIVLDLSGALYVPALQLLAVSDLHFEKASSHARRRQFVPPYDTNVTLTAVERAVKDYAPETVVCLGDSFHDPFAGERLDPGAIARLHALMSNRHWVWITGNHDPEIPAALSGDRAHELCAGQLTFRHIPQLGEAGRGEIAGHLHPCARILRRGRMVRRPCFAADNDRLIMPALGALTGGLNLSNPAFDGLFDQANLTAHMIGADQLHAVPARGLC